MHIQVKKWGNSASVRIPAALMQAAKLRYDQAVDIREEKGRLIIEPIAETLKLDDLLAGITNRNLHGETSFGPAMGKEIW